MNGAGRETKEAAGAASSAYYSGGMLARVNKPTGFTSRSEIGMVTDMVELIKLMGEMKWERSHFEAFLGLPSASLLGLRGDLN